MDRNAAITFSDQLREARENALRDSEAFDGILHAVERFGSFLRGRITHLGDYKEKIHESAIQSALAEDIPLQHPGYHIPFSLLYSLVREARNDALHQGAFARRLASHAIELSLVLEDALRRSVDSAVVGDYMVQSPICAEPWHPISFIRQRMLANSFSFLPLNRAGEWCLVSDLDIATYLGSDTKARNLRLANALETTGIRMHLAKLCTVDTPLDNALAMMADEQRPLLVFTSKGNQQALVSIITPFDLL